MKATRYLFLIAALAVPAVPASVCAQAAGMVPSVDARLKAIGVRYEVDKDGDYRVAYKYEKEGRTQLVYVGGAAQQVRGLTVRHVFAPAAILSRDLVDGAEALQLMEDAGQSKLGGWEMKGGVLYYAIKLTEPIDAKVLEQAMDVAAESADDMEIKLTGRDDL